MGSQTLYKGYCNTELYKIKVEQVPLLGYEGGTCRRFLFHLEEHYAQLEHHRWEMEKHKPVNADLLV
jgi:hypothetical protein